MEGRLKQITEVVRYITENPDYIIEGNWFCHNWRCKHEKKCQSEKECRNKCPHEPQCQTEQQCRTKWVCKHEPKCVTREQCQSRWTCRHKPICQNKWFCRKNWRCKHPSRCKDIWECKYRWTEEYEPHCQGRWQCYHSEKKCQTILQCQNRPFQDEWKCPHKCFNKWKCQNRWQCQHTEKCENSKKWKCQSKCQHQCANKNECLKKSLQHGERITHYETKWKCQHQCENVKECQKKWRCSHESPTCDEEWKCRSRGWRCQHNPPCESSCQDKWDRENEWECGHVPECETNWQCINDPQYQNKWQCKNRWTIGYSQDELRESLKKPHRQLYNFFTQQCMECRKSCIISSFILHTRPKTLKSEIICHLIWPKAKETKGDAFYRVFGNWTCKNSHSWDSSYTWISLRKFVEKCHGKLLKQRDFWKIKCHECQEDGTILKWSSIVGSKDGPLHERELCEKCRSGEICVQTNSYFG
ncbi:hypothetical protein RclHR1_03880015 [Rhizophagus clarus]|uniref:Uncharacterized protein n=1 Tax=Rhizophagus clarus TaxID=94130 RepID=A0A2Z6RQM4_9GLOM|nr:hypothetical protein RclHR1_03880015 [Rhizophagus clarus]